MNMKNFNNMTTVALILGIASIFGTLVGAWSNNRNNEFIEETNQDNRQFQEETNLQNHQWALEAAQWEYEHEKPQRQYADLLSAGITPAAAAQKVSGASASYSPATAVAPQMMPKSTDMLNDSLQKVFSDIGNYSSMAQAQSSAEKTQAETKVINETAINKAEAEIDKILADTLKSYSDVDVNDANIDLTNEKVETEQVNREAIGANIDLTNEKVETEKVNRKAIELSNEEKEIQLEFTRKTLEMSLQKTEAEIKFLSEQTAKLQAEVNGLNFENAYKEWRNTYINTYGVAPEQGWEDTLFKAVIDGKAEPMLDALSESFRQVFTDKPEDKRGLFKERKRATGFQKWYENNDDRPGYYSSIGDWYGYGSSW